MNKSLKFHNATFKEIQDTNKVFDEHGNTYPLHSGLDEEEASRLFQTVLTHQPKNALEIGMAYGISSLAICTALDQIESAKHDRKLISIDPNQSTDWKGVGVFNIEKSGLSKYHELITSPDYEALPNLLSQGTKIDFAYIDGWHTFDYTLIDFFYIDKMLNLDGIVVFNDCQLRSVQRVIDFLLSHRKYIELHIDKHMLHKNVKDTIKQRLINVKLGRKYDRYFQKQETWEPNWNFYRHF